MPVQGCTLPLPIPLLPLWTVQPVQSLSACTRVQFTFTYAFTPPMDCKTCTEPQCLYKGALYLYLYLYSPYVPYGLYRSSVPVQRCTLPLPVPLLPLWTVRHVQSLGACTTVHFTFYTLRVILKRNLPFNTPWRYRGGVDVKIHCFFNLDANGGGVAGQRHAPAAFPPGKARYPLYRRLGGPQVRSGLMLKISPPTGIRSQGRPARSESLY